MKLSRRVSQSRSKITRSKRLSLELLDERVVFSGSPWDIVTFDVASGVTSTQDYVATPTEGTTSEGGQLGNDFDQTPLDYPDGFVPSEPGESVFGNDDRTLISNPTTSPYRRHGSMRMLKTDGNWSFCSGAMIGPFHFLTAGHCVHEGGTGATGWYSNVQVTLGRDGDERWYGAANSTGITSVTGWTQSDDPNYDWAVIKLDRNLGNATGWNGHWWYSSNSTLNGMNVSIAGYPSDLATQWSQSTLSNDTHKIEMYESTGNMLNPTSHQLRYNGTLDTFGGMSGSSVIQDKPGSGRVAVGIHAYGDGGNGTNEATRMREPMANIIGSLLSDAAPTDRADLTDWDSWFHTNLAFKDRSTARPGDSFSVTTYPRNNGTASTGSYTVSFYASSNTIISTADHFLGSVAMGSLGRFAWDTAALTTTISDSIPEGTYNIGWIIDSGNTVSEFIEGNNTGYISGSQLTIQKALPDTWTGGVEGYAYSNNEAGGNAVNDTLSFDAFLNFSGDIDSYYFAPEVSGTHTITGSDFGNSVNPEIAIYDADTGAKIAWADDFLFSDDPLISVSLSSWHRYIVTIADHEEDTTGDVGIFITAPSSSSAQAVTIDASGHGGTSGLINANGDTDFYSVIAPTDATDLQVTLSPTAPLDGVVVLWDAAGNEIQRRDVAGVGGTETIVFGGVVPGNEYRATVFSRNYNSNAAFDLDFDFASSLLGDFDSDGDYDCDDIDDLVAMIASGANNVTFDMNSDGLVDTADLHEWLTVAGAGNLPSGNPYLMGDANLDGTVDGQDFIKWNNNKFTTGAGWCGGDFNADGTTDGQDYIAWNNNKFTSSALLAGKSTPVAVDAETEAMVASIFADLEAGSEIKPSIPVASIPVTMSSSGERAMGREDGYARRESVIDGLFADASLELAFA